jgi:hypothetical protein
MLIALLAVLGVNLIVIVVILGFVLARRLWVKRQPSAFPAAIRVAEGEVKGLGPKWKRGYARWVRDVLVWTKAPFLFRNVLLPTDRMDDERPASPDDVKRLGNRPVVVTLATGGAAVEMATAGEHSALLPGPYREKERR